MMSALAVLPLRSKDTFDGNTILSVSTSVSNFTVSPFGVAAAIALARLPNLTSATSAIL